MLHAFSQETQHSYLNLSFWSNWSPYPTSFNSSPPNCIFKHPLTY